MPYRQDLDTGEWIEVDAQGNPVADAPQGQVFTLPESPKQIADRAAKQAAADRAVATAERADREEARAAEKAEREALEWAATHNSDGSPKPKAGAKDKGGDKLIAARRILEMLDGEGGIREQFESNFEGGYSPLEYNFPGNPSDAPQNFDVTANAMLPFAKKLLRSPGEGSQSDKEGQDYRDQLPRASFRDSTNEMLIKQLRDTALSVLSENGYDRDAYDETKGTFADGQQAEDELAKAQATEDPSPDALPPVNEGGNDPMGPIASGDSRIESDSRVNSMINSLVNAGAGKPTIDAALKERGLPAISPGEWARVKAWQRDNPGVRYEGANVTREVPLSLLEKAAGSTLGSGVAHYANMAGAGIPAALAGERGKGALDAMEEANPNAAMTGKIFGGITGALGAEAALAARAPVALAKYMPRVADTAFGATLGFNEAEEGQGLQGAALGGAAALGGGYLGEKLMRGVGKAAQGVTDPAVRYLRDANIPLTTGQTLGGVAKGIEDRATSVPFVGDIINRRRMEGLDAFNNKAFQDAGRTIGYTPETIGKTGVDDLMNATGRAYDDATAGVSVPNDQQFFDDLVTVQQQKMALPDELYPRFDRLMENHTNPIDLTGVMTGEQFQRAMRGLKTARGKAGTVAGEFEQPYRDAVSSGMDAFEGLMTRGGGDDVVRGLSDADTAYRNTKILEDATQRAKGGSQSGETYTFTPSQLQMSVQKSQRRYPSDTPLENLADMGQQVLPSQIPDSGTAGRAFQMAAPAALGAGVGGYADGAEGAMTGTGLGLGATLALLAGGSRVSQKALTAALADRPEAILRAGELIANNSKLGRWTGTGVLTPLLVSP